MNNQHIGTKKAKKIPPPPGPGAGYDEIIAYHMKYTLDELEKAGHAVEPPPGELEKLAASAIYSGLCEQGLRLKLSKKDYERLSRLAAHRDVAVEELVKCWITQRLNQESKQLVAVKTH